MLVLMLGQGARLISTGLLIGMVVASLVTGAIERWLFETPATDPAGLSAAAVLIGLSAMVASWLPAWRASRVDPSVTLAID
ncbi:MAG TPA: hypothetical protein VMM93_07755 [Vicinamibacterales bacterium]|nr:hypothetical protein [Vicinamibacterales bacterium]